MKTNRKGFMLIELNCCGDYHNPKLPEFSVQVRGNITPSYKNNPKYLSL